MGCNPKCERLEIAHLADAAFYGSISGWKSIGLEIARWSDRPVLSPGDNICVSISGATHWSKETSTCKMLDRMLTDEGCSMLSTYLTTSDAISIEMALVELFNAWLLWIRVEDTAAANIIGEFLRTGSTIFTGGEGFIDGHAFGRFMSSRSLIWLRSAIACLDRRRAETRGDPDPSLFPFRIFSPHLPKRTFGRLEIYGREYAPAIFLDGEKILVGRAQVEITYKLAEEWQSTRGRTSGWVERYLLIDHLRKRHFMKGEQLDPLLRNFKDTRKIILDESKHGYLRLNPDLLRTTKISL